MLTRILEVLASAPQPLCAETLATMLDIEVDRATAMLDELVVRGRVRTGAGVEACQACRAQAYCGAAAADGPLYSLVTQPVADEHQGSRPGRRERR